MSHLELYVSPTSVFGGFRRTFEEANYVILGVPLDVTSTFRSGARFAPSTIREASINIEGYSFRANVDIEDLSLHDLGDLEIGAVNVTLKRLEMVTKEILDAKRLPLFLGGEHTITLGAMHGLGRNIAVVNFDAHLDLRNEFMGRTTSHTTFMRRIHEQIRPKEILGIGTRAVCREELEYAEKHGIPFITVQQIRETGVSKTMNDIAEILDDCKEIYLTIDLDVLDPAFAPAVQNPEPGGLDIQTFLDLLCKLCDSRVIAFDLVEVTPHYDKGITAIQATKTIFEVLCHLERARK